MKKLIILAITCVMLLSLVLPSVALAVSSVVTVASGGGATPFVKCKWEQQPVAVCAELEDADPSHATAGFQILPPLKKCATKTIEYYAVVTDAEDSGYVAQAFADVYHPALSPSPYKDKVGGIPNLSYFKYEIPFTNLEPTLPSPTDAEKAAALAIFEKAYKAGLITFGTGFTYADVKTELEKGTAALWKGQAEIDYEQPAGDYKVYVFAIDTNNNLSAPVINMFTYIAVAGVEIDFNKIDWGTVNLGKEKMIIGDVVWNIPAATNNATVRNVGNTWAGISVKFSDMGFGQDINGNWNVNFDARLGNDQVYYVGGILPNKTYNLPNALALSKMDELDLSIKVIKGYATHEGSITVGTFVVPFADPVPATIVGSTSPCDPKS